MEEKKLTGYPSIDRPQEKFYRKQPVRDIKTEQTIYELVFNSNKENMSSPALEYMGAVWTFEKLKAEADRAADAFSKAGLKLGDTVLLGVSNCPEAIAALLALNAVEEHVPMVYIILKDDTADHEAAKQSIYQKCRSELKEYEIPKYFQVVTELPYTQNGKYDFRLLEKQGNEFVEKHTKG